MVETRSTMQLALGTSAPAFRLPNPEGHVSSLEDFGESRALLVAFICNHCPFVKHVGKGFGLLAKEYQDKGVGVVGINSNDSQAHPGDSPEKMLEEARSVGYTFPYLVDESQEVARAYDAVCTPDFFGFNKDLELQYRGRLDESKTTLVEGARRELYEAMVQIAETGRGPAAQIASMGCSIKWRAA